MSVSFRSSVFVKWVSQIKKISQGSIKRRTSARRSGNSFEQLEERLLLTPASDGNIASFVEIADSLNGAPDTALGDLFGGSVASIGDIDGDGVTDLAVGAPGDDTGGIDRGAIYLLRLNADGSVKAYSKIASAVGGGPVLPNHSQFGSAVTSIGDLNGDGIGDLAVGAAGDDIDSRARGAVYILFLDEDGSVKASTRIASGENGGPRLQLLNHFGKALAFLGNNGEDGAPRLAVGAPDGTDSNEPGVVYVLSLNSNGSVQSSQKISPKKYSGTLFVPNGFGSSLAVMRDSDSDGAVELAIGSPRSQRGETPFGYVLILDIPTRGKPQYLGTFGEQFQYGPGVALGMGTSLANVGDLNGDGRDELAVGSSGRQIGRQTSTVGTVYLVNFVRFSMPSYTLISDNAGGGPDLAEGDYFGLSVAGVGDLNGDGLPDLVVGARDHNFNQASNGALYMLYPEIQNQRPTLALNGGPVTLTSVNQPVPVMPNVTVTDPDTASELQLAGGRLLISFDASSRKRGTESDDELQVNDASLAVTHRDRYVINGRCYMGFNIANDATLEEIQNGLRTITFMTSKAGLKMPTRTLTITLYDFAGAASGVITQTINITA